jgi:uncharacterized protein YndB with AHSA1/START domain
MLAVAQPQDISLHLNRRYPFPPAAVFRAWTDPAAMKRWFAPTDEYEVPEVEVDLRVGGRYRIVMRAPDGEVHRVSGVYREIAPPDRLVFTWAWASTPERESLVTVELRTDGGATELSLTHSRFFDEPARDRHQHGWSGCLERLGRHAFA